MVLTVAEYYTQGIGRRRKKPRKARSWRTVTLFLLDTLMTLLTAILVVASLITVIGQYISPLKSGVISVAALGAPVLYLFDLVVMFYWIVRWKWWRVAVMALVVVVGLPYLSRYYKMDIRHDYGTKYVERNFTKVMSYNILEGRQKGVADSVLIHKPDILCVQEMSIGSDNWARLGKIYNTTYNPAKSSPVQILSKYRIIRHGGIDTLSLNRAVWADLRISNDTVRVVNMHLQSTAIRKEDTQFLEKHEYIYDNERKSKFGSIVSRLVENNRRRALQAEHIADFIAKSPYPTIVCGDFNDVPMSYTYHILSRGLHDTFREMARGYEYTYNTTYGLLRIDNIFVTPDIEVVSYEVDMNMGYSDHYPVIARLKIEDKR
ncbi:MAG: endonuclease/exonuclease/phosphatase family protein [Alistipes sp.]|nr:endonuclease/exonuclease/phosphatase family protein [Alistipes sp.]